MITKFQPSQQKYLVCDMEERVKPCEVYADSFSDAAGEAAEVWVDEWQKPHGYNRTYKVQVEQLSSGLFEHGEVSYHETDHGYGGGWYYIVEGKSY